MTNNQIAFWTLEHDKAKTARAQRETERSNRAREDEAVRSNRAREDEAVRSNLAKEAETYRSNIAKETETNRANVASENIQRDKLAEDRRHNYSTESTKNLETQTKAFGPVVGSIRHQADKGGTQSEQQINDRLLLERNSVLGKASEKQLENVRVKERKKKSRSRGSR